MKRKTAPTSRISYQLGLKEGLFSRLELRALEQLNQANKPLNRIEISELTGIRECSLCNPLNQLVNAQTIGTIEKKNTKTNRKVYHYFINSSK